jgi:hypothetical protein
MTATVYIILSIVLVTIVALGVTAMWATASAMKARDEYNDSCTTLGLPRPE